jgi:hypothetical protein
MSAILWRWAVARRWRVKACRHAQPRLCRRHGGDLVLWAYEGWQYVTFSAGESVNPKRSLPIAIGTGTAIIVAIYLLANFGYLAALGSAQVAHRTASRRTR